jgi:hypothetical protein
MVGTSLPGFVIDPGFLDQAIVADLVHGDAGMHAVGGIVGIDDVEFQYVVAAVGEAVRTSAGVLCASTGGRYTSK